MQNCIQLHIILIINKKHSSDMHSAYPFTHQYTIIEPEILGNRNINFNQILISLQWFLIAELYRYLCYGCLKFPARIQYANKHAPCISLKYNLNYADQKYAQPYNKQFYHLLYTLLKQYTFYLKYTQLRKITKYQID